MDFRKIQAFSKVYERGSFSKAGDELFLSQPTISAHVAALENELDVRLFDRIGRNILPTQAADILYRRGKEIFQILNLARAEVEMLNGTVSGSVVIGGSTIPSNHILPSILASFRSLHPSVNIDLHCSDSLEVANMVRDGQLMCGVIGMEPDFPELNVLPLLSDTLVIIASPSLARRYAGADLLKDIVDAPWIMRERGSGTGQSALKSFERLGIPAERLNVVAKVQSTESLIRFALAGIGFGITSGLAVRDALESGELISFDLKDFWAKRRFVIVYHAKRKLFPNIRALIAYIDKVAHEQYYPS